MYVCIYVRTIYIYMYVYTNVHVYIMFVVCCLSRRPSVLEKNKKAPCPLDAAVVCRCQIIISVAASETRTTRNQLNTHIIIIIYNNIHNIITPTRNSTWRFSFDFFYDYILTSALKDIICLMVCLITLYIKIKDKLLYIKLISHVNIFLYIQ